MNEVMVMFYQKISTNWHFCLTLRTVLEMSEPYTPVTKKVQNHEKKLSFFYKKVTQKSTPKMKKVTLLCPKKCHFFQAKKKVKRSFLEFCE